MAGMFTAPAYAEDTPSHYYVSGGAGGTWFNSIQRREPFTFTTKGDIVVTGAFGYAFCDGWRLETELSYQQNKADTGYYYSTPFTQQGTVNIASYMVNGYYDIKAGAVNPYVYAGMGIAEMNLVGVGPVLFNQVTESHTAFGYQFGAGASIPVAKDVDIDVRYKYFRTSNVALNNGLGDLHIGSNSFLVGLRVGI